MAVVNIAELSQNQKYGLAFRFQKKLEQVQQQNLTLQQQNLQIQSQNILRPNDPLPLNPLLTEPTIQSVADDIFLAQMDAAFGEVVQAKIDSGIAKLKEAAPEVQQTIMTTLGVPDVLKPEVVAVLS